VLGEQLDIPVYSDRTNKDPVAVCQAAIKEAKAKGADTVILDTAGRLHIDQELMGQLERIDRQCSPQQVYLVVDSMTGQDAVNSAKAFNDALELDGVILTKLDGDARGGAALSVKQVTGVPIKFIGTGEHLDALEEFHPDRMAGRILGMGDVLTLIEQAERAFEADQAEQAAARLMEGEFTLDDFLEQMQSIKKMGSLSSLLGMMPGMPKELKNAKISDDDLKPIEAIIRSMTFEERARPQIINGSRRGRIARGAGCDPGEVTRLIKQFGEMQKMMRQLGGGGGRRALLQQLGRR
jgi:signal recognition particle subunit SRP54